MCEQFINDRMYKQCINDRYEFALSKLSKSDIKNLLSYSFVKDNTFLLELITVTELPKYINVYKYLRKAFRLNKINIIKFFNKHNVLKKYMHLNDDLLCSLTRSVKLVKYLHRELNVTYEPLLTIVNRLKFYEINNNVFNVIKYLHRNFKLKFADFWNYPFTISNFNMIKFMHVDLGLENEMFNELGNYVYYNNMDIGVIKYLHETVKFTNETFYQRVLIGAIQSDNIVVTKYIIENILVDNEIINLAVGMSILNNSVEICAYLIDMLNNNKFSDMSNESFNNMIHKYDDILFPHVASLIEAKKLLEKY